MSKGKRRWTYPFVNVNAAAIVGALSLALALKLDSIQDNCMLPLNMLKSHERKHSRNNRSNQLNDFCIKLINYCLLFFSNRHHQYLRLTHMQARPSNPITIVAAVSHQTVRLLVLTAREMQPITPLKNRPSCNSSAVAVPLYRTVISALHQSEGRPLIPPEVVMNS